MAPRLIIGALAGDTPLALALERAGHAVHPIDAAEDPGAIQHVDLVLLDADTETVQAALVHLQPYARPRQMFLHTALEHGAQLLDDVETAHAIVMCAHNLFGEVWVTSAADELGETVIGLLIAEIGGTNIPLDDTDRPAIVAAQRLRALETTLRADAYDQLAAAIPALELMQPEFFAAPAPDAQPQTPQELDRIAAAIADPGVRRLFVDVERRRAEQWHATDVELWAYSKYEGTI